MPPPRIAIVGAGPAGLTLARLLQQGGLPCTIFELDDGQSARDQGGIVDLHPRSGQLALREADLSEDFQQLALPAGEAMKLMKSDGTICWDENNSKDALEGQPTRERPEIDRTALRRVLLDSLDPGSIQWDKKIVRVEPAGEKYDLHFTHGVETGFDLVVGADGAWSKVRPLLTDVRPHYSGITVIELRAKEISEKKQ